VGAREDRLIDPQTELVIFDADGTLRYVTVQGQHYPLGHDQWALLPGVAQTMSTLPVSRLKFGVASNQHGVALGELSRELAEELLISTWQAAFSLRAPPVLIEMCTCLPEATCHRRKPQPGMLEALMRRHAVPPERVLYVGDLAIDAEAASRAHVRFSWARDFFEG